MNRFQVGKKFKCKNREDDIFTVIEIEGEKYLTNQDGDIWGFQFICPDDFTEIVDKQKTNITRFEQFKQKFADMTLEELAEYIDDFLEEENKCCCCVAINCFRDVKNCRDGITKYLKEEVNE